MVQGADEVTANPPGLNSHKTKRSFASQLGPLGGCRRVRLRIELHKTICAVGVDYNLARPQAGELDESIWCGDAQMSVDVLRKCNLSSPRIHFAGFTLLICVNVIFQWNYPPQMESLKTALS